MSRVRPTIRCLRKDLEISKLPPADVALDTLDHPVIRKANAMFATAEASCERIAAIDDEVFCKVKITRWRGALWRQLPEQWICAAGWREAGDPDDFYAALAGRGRAWRAEYNASNRPTLTTDTWTERLLPENLDRKRLALEEADARARAMRKSCRAWCGTRSELEPKRATKWPATASRS